MAPSNRAVGHDTSRNTTAATAVKPEVRATPTVASSSAGLRPVRKVAKSVRRPPSSKMMASAMLPTQKLSR